MDRFHEECWDANKLCEDDGKNVCAYCGLHDGKEQYCCNKDWSYGPGDHCYNANFASEGRHRCVTKADPTPSTSPAPATTPVPAPSPGAPSPDAQPDCGDSTGEYSWTHRDAATGKVTRGRTALVQSGCEGTFEGQRFTVSGSTINVVNGPTGTLGGSIGARTIEWNNGYTFTAINGAGGGGELGSMPAGHVGDVNFRGEKVAIEHFLGQYSVFAHAPPSLSFSASPRFIALVAGMGVLGVAILSIVLKRRTYIQVDQRGWLQEVQE